MEINIRSTTGWPRRRVWGFAAWIIATSAGSVMAQYPSGISRGSSSPFGSGRSSSAVRSSMTSRPTFSPYLNLLRGGDPVLNYYGLVRPEQEFRATNDQFRMQFGQVQDKFDSIEQRQAVSNLGVTGHHVRFLADQTGGAGSIPGTLNERTARSQKLPPTPASRIPPSGHGAYFSNHGAYYPFPNR